MRLFMIAPLISYLLLLYFRYLAEEQSVLSGVAVQKNEESEGDLRENGVGAEE